MTDHILTLNAGSSSVKFALYAVGAQLRRVASGAIDGLGATPEFSARIAEGESVHASTSAREHQAAVDVIVEWIRRNFAAAIVCGVGHRIVHGGLDYSAPVVVDQSIVEELAQLAPLAPLHQPHNLAGVLAAMRAYPDARQIGCFDTAFHRGHDFVNDAYALPRAFYERGLRRFGFHGLSYEYIARRLETLSPDVARGRVVIAHLGAGASLCAIREGRSIACTMGFSPLDGLPMATRSGGVDPGLLLYLMEHENLSREAIGCLLYRESGLKGLSGLSGDMRMLEAAESPHAAQAIAYFAHRVRIEIAGMTAALGGLDALVFTAGIGEHSARLRADVLSAMAWLGLTVDEEANAINSPCISKQGALPVLVVPTNEESMIAQHVMEIMNGVGGFAHSSD